MPTPVTCFFEHDPAMALGRRATAEGVGTMLLMLALTGAGLTGQRLFHQEPLLGLAMSAVVTSGALTGLIIAFGAVSGGHFNPVISLLQWLGGERKLDCALAYVVCQTIGAIIGAALANFLFAAPSAPSPAPAGAILIVSEIVATGALMAVVFGCARSGKADTGPFAVGAWLTAAIIATPSTSYANPAIVIAALLANGPVNLGGQTALSYVAAEAVGGLAALLIISVCYPRAAAQAGANRTEASGAARSSA
jgi:glycerol uptake facilitator-like aquaporin